jgi:hypothetical protein
MNHVAGRGRKRRVPRGLPRVNRAARAVAAHSHTDAGPDQIVCLLCGETFRAITYLHLRLIHGMEGPHPIRAYKRRFVLDYAVCDDSRDLIRKAKVARDRRQGRHWSQARITREIRSRAREAKGLARSDVPLQLSEAAVRIMGSWDAALLASGEDPGRHRKVGVWNDVRVIAEIREFAASGQASSKHAKQDAPSLHDAAIRGFGSWGRALRSAGLDPHEHSERDVWSVNLAEGWVRDRVQSGRPFGTRSAPSGLVHFVSRETGLRWPEYVESLGLTYPKRRYESRWTDRDVIEAIRRRRRERLALNAKAVARDVGQGLVKQARQRFGSWDAALRAAGLKPEQIRLNRTWTKQAVVAAIRERARAGRSLSRRDTIADDSRLVKAAARLFPTSWGRALVAAGFEPALARRDAPGRPARARRHK